MATETAGESVQVASASGKLARSVAGAANPAKPTLGRLVDSAAALQLAIRVLPACWRLLKRYPLPSSLIILGAAWAAYSLRSTNAATRQ